jgi:hypothetical protein
MYLHTHDKIGTVESSVVVVPPARRPPAYVAWRAGTTIHFLLGS